MTAERARPLVLVGVGGEIAPLLTIVRTWAEAGFPAPIWFVQGARHGRDHPFGDEIRTLAGRHADLHLDISYSRARTTDVLGSDYQRNGRVNLATLKRLPPGPDADFALCGPTDVIADLRAGLMAWGVPEDRIRQLGETAPPARFPLLRRRSPHGQSRPRRDPANPSRGTAGRHVPPSGYRRPGAGS